VRTELVQDWMSSNPTTVSPYIHLTEVSRLMKDHAIRRLPVVANGQLVGIVTWGDVRKASASDVPALGHFEAGYLLDKITVERIMTPDPITIAPDTPVTEAAEIMLTYKIGGLPVMAEGKLIGIITGSDIFRLLTGKAA
jgi:CBS domain-containing protein